MKKIVFALMFCFSTSVLAGPALVKGAIDPKITQENMKETVCVPNYTKTVRPPASYTNKLKLKQMKDFNLPGSPKDYEEDHLIPLVLGGNPTSPDNLWPQPWEGENGAHKKDRLEVKLHKLTCSGEITLEQAQKEIAEDWIAAYEKYVDDHTSVKRSH